jgi:hypothetical protein
LSDLDLRGPKKDEKLRWRPIDHHSELWAKIASPFAWFIFSLSAAVILLPHVLILRGGMDPEQTREILDWSKTVLAPSVGFASAVIGYYFGTRSSTANEEAPDPPDL